MRKLALALAAFAMIGVSVPCAALADAVIIHKHRDMYNYAPPPHHNKTVIIKHHNDY